MKLNLLGEPPVPPSAAHRIHRPEDATGDYYLHWRDDRYHLCDRQQRHPPLSLDLADYLGRRGSETLPKTLRGMAGAHIADATAGWGKDAWLLASRGFTLTLYERKPCSPMPCNAPAPTRAAPPSPPALTSSTPTRRPHSPLPASPRCTSTRCTRSGAKTRK